MRPFLVPTLLLFFLLQGCDATSEDSDSQSSGDAASVQVPNQAPDVDQEKELRLKLLNAKPGDVIEIAAGTIAMTRSLILNESGVTIRGAGMDKTILSFKTQIAGAEGLLVNASDFTIEDIAIEDARGDALKINEGKNIIVRRVRTEWTNGPDTNNGAYGIYPVQTENTLIEESIAIAASDAGIYVGQSRNVVVRNNRAEFNVAGIEIENTISADVYGNTAVDNTGGILVFNMPDLPQPGYATRVYNNTINHNNTENFGARGTAVAGVPAGSGIVINSNDQVEIFDNDINDNQTANIIISSYYSVGEPTTRKTAEAFDPYPESIFIYDNRFSGGGNKPDGADLETLRAAIFGETGVFPNVLWDGIINSEKTENGVLKPEYAICLGNGDAGIVNLDNGNANKNVTTEIKNHSCTLEKLPAIDLGFSLSAG